MAVKKPKVAAVPKVKRVKLTVEFAPMKFNDFTITQKRSGRFAVVSAKGKNVNGAEKEKLLLAAKVLKGSFKKDAAAETAAT
jgi:hypothetical protein